VQQSCTHRHHCQSWGDSSRHRCPCLREGRSRLQQTTSRHDVDRCRAVDRCRRQRLPALPAPAGGKAPPALPVAAPLTTQTTTHSVSVQATGTGAAVAPPRQARSSGSRQQQQQLLATTLHARDVAAAADATVGDGGSARVRRRFFESRCEHATLSRPQRQPHRRSGALERVRTPAQEETTRQAPQRRGLHAIRGIAFNCQRTQRDAQRSGAAASTQHRAHGAARRQHTQ
jgi:hypothetical protein